MPDIKMVKDKMILLGLLYFLSVIQFSICAPEVEHIVYQENIDSEEDFIIHQISPTPMKQMGLNFTIRFKKEKCCPVVYVYAQTPNPPYNSTHVDHKCFVGGDGFVNAATISHYFIYLKQNFPRVHCFQEGEDTICVGNRHFAFPTERTWWYAIGYECDKRQPLNVSLNFDYRYNELLKCDGLFNRCQRDFGYNATTFPNRLGHAKQSEAAILLRTLELLIHSTGCYKHGYQAMCRTLFQECRGGHLYIPCQQTCKDFVKGCNEPLTKWNQKVRCGNFPPSLDQNICWYAPVVCPHLQPPEFGSLTTSGYTAESKALYQCDEGFDLVGPPVRMCTYSGTWNGTDEIACVPANATAVVDNVTKPEPSSFNIVVLIVSITTLILVIVLVAIGIRFRKDLSLLLMHNYYVNGKLKHPPNNKNKVFLTYSSLDSELVEKHVLQAMQTNLGNTWEVITFERDFLPGRPLLDCINEAVWESHAVLVLLSNNYINSDWCNYEFTEALTRSAIDNQFRLITIMLDFSKEKGGIEIEKLPRHLKNFVETRVYLSFNERFFWNKLRKGLTD